MKNILLLYPDMLFYKISIFNKLDVFLEKNGFRLLIWYTSIDDQNKECKFNYVFNTPMTLNNYTKIIKDEKIDIVINILFKTNPGIRFYFYSIFKAKYLRIPIIYYGHGINKQKNQGWRNFLYNLTYFIFDGIILYTPAEKDKLWRCFHHKITCANNTLDIEEMIIRENKEQIKARYKIKEPKIVLTSGRLHSRKRIEILSTIFIENFKESNMVAWVLIGPDLSEEVKHAISGINNIYYLGPIYEKGKMAELFSIADIYCVPGALGLGIIEALYWGLPVLTLKVNHGPEAFYLRHNVNSLLAKDNIELALMIQDILFDNEKKQLFSDNAKRIFADEATLNKMFEGFRLQLNRFFNETNNPKF